MEIMALAANGTTGNTTQNNWTIIVVLVAIIALAILLRRRRGGGSNLEMAMNLIGDVRHNLTVLSKFSATTPTFKKLKTGNWKRTMERITFLDEQLRNHINDAFKLSQEFNDRLNAAKLNKSTSYLMGVPTDKLKEALDKSREGLGAWIKENYQKEMFSRRRGLFW
jgi:LPXTG-motif cell wall-anchored protein